MKRRKCSCGAEFVAEKGEASCEECREYEANVAAAVAGSSRESWLPPSGSFTRPTSRFDPPREWEPGA